MPKYFKGIKVKNINITKQIPALVMLFIPQITTRIYNMLDTTMLGTIIKDKSETGFYDQSQKIIRVLLTIVTSLGTVMVPRMANLFANKEKEKINEYLTKSFNFTYLLSFPIIFGLIAISKNFVPWFFGQGYDKVVILMNIITPIILFMGIANIIGTQYLLPTKRQKEYTISILVGLIINFILNYIMIHLWKSIGACIATVLSELIVVIMQIHYVKNEINIKEKIGLSYKYLLSSLIMFVFCYIVQFAITGFYGMVIQIMLGIIIYFGMLILFKDEFIFLLLNKIRQKITTTLSRN